MAKISQIIKEAQEMVGEVAGSGVQTYGEDRMLADCVRSFNLIYKKRFWEVYTKWVRITLDGVTGVPNNDVLKQVIDFEDFKTINFAGTDKRIPLLNSRVNPLQLSGTIIRCWSSLNANDEQFRERRLQFWPITATGQVDIQARFYPVEQGEDGHFTWTQEDDMFLDKDMLVYGTVYMTLTGDDTNEGATDAARNLMDMRYRDVVSALADQPIETGLMQASILDHWASN